MWIWLFIILLAIATLLLVLLNQISHVGSLFVDRDACVPA